MTCGRDTARPYLCEIVSRGPSDGFVFDTDPDSDFDFDGWEGLQ
jgi:hypothetical protein